jgi:hypothetical protein
MEGNFNQEWAMPQTFGAGNSLPPELLKYIRQQQPSASGWDGGGYTFGDYTVAPVSGIQTNSDGSITNYGAQGYVSENNARSQKENIANPNAMANLYGMDGAYQSSFRPEDPYAQDPMELVILAALAAGGGATMMGLGGGGFGLGNSALGSLGGLGGVAEAGTAAGMMGGASGAATAAGGIGGLTSTMGGAPELMGPMTESALGDSFASQFGQYLSPSSIMGPMTQEQLASSFQKQFSPYLANGVGAAGGGAASAAGGGGGGAAGAGKSLIPGVSNGSLLGGASTLLGGLAGAQGTPGTSQSSTRSMDPRMDALFYGDLAPRVQGTMGEQMPMAQQYGSDMINQGRSMTGAPVAGNGFGKVQLNAPTTATNPYLSGMADDIQRRTQEMLAQNNLAIQGAQVGAGGFGSTRQGVAQGTAAGKAADYLSGNLSNLFGTQYSNDQNRALQQYGQDQSFYANQRGQDLAQVGVGAGLLDQGFKTQWSPLQNAAQTYQPFTGFGSTTNSTPDQKGGWQGAVGGLLTGASMGRTMGWW